MSYLSKNQYTLLIFFGLIFVWWDLLSSIFFFGVQLSENGLTWTSLLNLIYGLAKVFVFSILINVAKTKKISDELLQEKLKEHGFHK